MVCIVRESVHGMAPDSVDVGPTGGAPRGRGAAAAGWQDRAGRDRATLGGQPDFGGAVEAAARGARRAWAAPAAAHGPPTGPDSRPMAAAPAHAAARRRRGWVRDRALDGAADHRGRRARLRRAVPPALARPGAAGPRLEPAGAPCPRAGARRRAGRGLARAGLAAHQKSSYPAVKPRRLAGGAEIGDGLLAVGTPPAGADAATEHVALATALLAEEALATRGARVDGRGARGWARCDGDGGC